MKTPSAPAAENPTPKRLGRPPLSQTKKRFSIRLLPEDSEAFGAAAKKVRRGMTTWMRETCRAAVGLSVTRKIGS
jgi:predicted HicB family RNase H-like nuclease